MQDEISRMPAEEDEQAEKGVLGLLLASARSSLGRSWRSSASLARVSL
jgi:hypothetical protein